MSCPICDEEMEELYHIMDLDNDAGICGSICMSKGLFDEGEHIEFAMMILSVVDSWLRRREFEHNNLELYHILS